MPDTRQALAMTSPPLAATMVRIIGTLVGYPAALTYTLPNCTGIFADRHAAASCMQFPVNGARDINAYLNLLGRDCNLTLVGAPAKPLMISLACIGRIARFLLLWGCVANATAGEQA